ncbi:MAG: hypothetical protein E1N59_2853 [Puniceicoccaceae bacterium 5H]|nr:MAG: hypothetical protein E1N59_2853 [Puniceicoccaceae bacterium 5H]
MSKNSNQSGEEPKPRRGKTNLPIPESIQKEANSANAGINVPLNLDCWQELSEEYQDELIWYHQHLIDKNIQWKNIHNTIGYERSVIFKILKGTYPGSWDNVIAAIRKYRASIKQIQNSTFAANRISRLISSTLDYASISGGIVMIIGESGQGKTAGADDWMHRHNGGRTAMVEVPPTGGHKGVLRALCAKSKAGKNASVTEMEASVRRAFNSRRFMILDEAARLLPTDRRSHPYTVEFFRSLHDEKELPMGLMVTSRFEEQLRKMDYVFEQLLGRIDLTVKLPTEMTEEDYLPMVAQFIPEPSRKLHTLCLEIVNQWDGRMRALNKLLKFSSRIASNSKEPLEEKHVFQATAWRKRLQKGEVA